MGSALGLALAMVTASCGPAGSGPDDPENAEGEADGEGEGETGAPERVPCVDDVDCAGGFVCSGFFDAPGVNFCTAACESDAACADDDGYSYACEARADGNRVCMRTCTTSSDDCDDHGFCVANNLCVGRGPRCSSDGQCADDESCTYDGGSVDFIAVCGAAAREGALRTGDTCDPGTDNPTADEQCGVGFCEPHGLCPGVCATESDCPDGFSCQGAFVPTASSPALITFCRVGENDGPACERDSECAAGEVCAFARDIAGFGHGVCRVPRVEERLAREPCDATIPCASGVCDGDRCGVLCSRFDLNGGCPDDETCENFDDATRTLRLCRPGAPP